MLKNTPNLSSVKEYVKTCADSKVKVNLNLGRNKSVTFFGVLSGIYPALFTVKPDEKKLSRSYGVFLFRRIVRHGKNQEDFIGGVPPGQNYALLPN